MKKVSAFPLQDWKQPIAVYGAINTKKAPGQQNANTLLVLPETFIGVIEWQK